MKKNVISMPNALNFNKDILAKELMWPIKSLFCMLLYVITAFEEIIFNNYIFLWFY